MTVYVDHYTGVDFRFQSVEPGYAQTITEMEKHLIGFSHTQLEAVPICHEIGEEIHLLWKRDETIQPFQLQPEDTRDPTVEELAQMEAARHASIVTSARLLGRPLTPEELECIQVWFENGHIMGSTAPPLSDQLREQVNKLRNPGT
ncbi:MAG: hypothetical protein KA791_06950 [Flavobacteriales bacterium]|nr:hypothetical protein [Flavobacteriales bacterium]